MEGLLISGCTNNAGPIAKHRVDMFGRRGVGTAMSGSLMWPAPRRWLAAERGVIEYQDAASHALA
jgi:hypothetical protein